MASAAISSTPCPICLVGRWGELNMRLLVNPFVPVGCQKKAAHDIILLAIVSNGAIMYSTNTWIAIFQKSSNHIFYLSSGNGMENNSPGIRFFVRIPLSVHMSVSDMNRKYMRSLIWTENICDLVFRWHVIVSGFLPRQDLAIGGS